MSKLNRTFFGIVIIFILLLLLGGKRIFRAHSEIEKEYQYLSLFSEVVSLVKTKYVEAVDTRKKFPVGSTALNI